MKTSEEMDRPTVSVIVAAFNAEATLERCLNSIAAQTLPDFEVIVINDGSSDGTATIAKRFASEDSRFFLYEQANQGLAATMNRGLDLARGDFISFVDADDYILPNMYEDLVGDARQYDAEVVAGGLHTVSEDGRTIRKTTTRLRGLFDAEEYLKHVLRADTTVSLRDKIFRADVIRHIRFVPGRFYEDMDAGLAVFNLCKRVFVRTGHYYCYVWHPGGVTKQISPKLVDDYCDSVLRTRALLQQQGKFDRLWLDFLDGVLARTVNFVNQALEFAPEQERPLAFGHAIELARRLDQEGILTAGTLRVLETRHRPMVQKYRVLHTAVSDPNIILARTYRSMKDHAVVSPGQGKKKRLESSLPYAIAKRFVEEVDRRLPKGSRRRAIVPATRALLTRDPEYFRRHVLPLFRKTNAHSEKVVVRAPWLFSVDGKRNFELGADGAIQRNASVRCPDLSRFKNAMFFYVEDASIASHVDKWFRYGFFDRDSTLIIYRYVKRDAPRVLPHLLTQGYHFLCASSPQEHPFDTLENVFYPFCGSLSNLAVIDASRGRVRHIGIGHGESDKLGSVYPQFRYYDHIFVSGDSAIDRLRNCDIIDDYSGPRKTVRIGLPFEPTPTRARFTSSNSRPLRILYAPTWNEEQAPGLNYCSVVNGFALKALLPLVASERVEALHFRPHPMMGWSKAGDPVTAAEELIRALQDSDKFELQLNKAAYAYERLAVACRSDRRRDQPRDISEYDVVLSDVSSVSTMALQARVPCIVMCSDELWSYFENTGLRKQLTITSKMPLLLSSQGEQALELALHHTRPEAEQEWANRRAYVISYDHPQASESPTSRQLELALAWLAAPRDDESKAVGTHLQSTGTSETV
jgi:glycosyltransferase involved in cell wall biosynthesis